MAEDGDVDLLLLEVWRRVGAGSSVSLLPRIWVWELRVSNAEHFTRHRPYTLQVFGYITIRPGA